MGYSN